MAFSFSFDRLFRGQYTARQAATLFVITLLSAISFRSFVLEAHDPYKCRALLRDGHWYDDSTWLTPGCHGEGYGAHSMHECMHNKKISLIGDDSIQGIYWSLRQKLDEQTPLQPAEHDSFHEDGSLQLEYIWDPFLNRSELFEYVHAFQTGQDKKPTILVIGSPRLLAERGDVDGYRSNLDSILNLVRPPKSFANPGFQNFDIDNGPGDLLLFAPLQAPLTNQDTNSAYTDMNAYLQGQANGYGLDVLWSFDRMTAGREDKYLDDKSTPHPDIVRRRADLLVSLRCTARFSQARSFPNTRSCCGTWRHRNWIQTSFLSLGLVMLPAAVGLDAVYPVFREQDRTVLRAFSAFTAAVSLQYLADRTHVFEQVKRLYLVPLNLRIMLGLALVVGLVTIRRSSTPKKSATGEKPASLPFLPRDQTDEIKGWMQLCIIIYHYNMAWTADWYWEVIRVCVAGYLFLTGFGHAVYFLRKGDFSLNRVVAVMLRTNLLPVSLAYVMRTRWLLYYYMPLSSFWFLVVYATLAVGAKYNTYRTFVIAKILASAYLVDAFIQVRDLPETVVRFASLVFKMSFDADAFFHHRVHIDQYIVYVGMLIAIFYIWALDALDADRAHGYTKRIFRAFFPPLQIAATALSAGAFVYFWYWAQTHIRSQGQWTERQPSITAIPILSFLILRNAHGSMRNYASVAFAWLGRYSGEMYVMQDHLWLAGDQEAVLRSGLFRGDETLLGDRWRDLVLLTPLYLCACWVIGDSTAVITGWFVKEAGPRQRAAATEVDEVETGLLGEKDGAAESRVLEHGKSAWRRIADTLSEILWPGKVRDRAILLLGFLWLLNLTYS